ncbi:hypothetical protein [Secundilactobacillus mixtipabuli]|uniref:Uncharacterized protein n=1 Tax=Secundilactobacillus mixtipabuli TaxID=1435342 RepID=A0A1Z5IE36_9LACO|nr:hypothetical protein [Secundilactobacillus mixtipabuli]GAW99982.1 hypothetical protein IWT30_01962 [Secundilactobacillus mixtipabuli]
MTNFKNNDRVSVPSCSKFIKLTAMSSLAMLSFSAISTPLVSSVTVHAATNQSVNSTKTTTGVEDAQPQLVKESDVQELIQDKLATATPDQMNEIAQKVRGAVTTTVQGNETIMEIKDSALEHAYLSVLAPNVLVVGNRKTGVTKIVWHGAMKKGNADLYLSKRTLVGAHAGAAAVGLLAIVALTYEENYKKAAKTMGYAIKQTVASSKVKNGKIFEMRHWTSIKVKNQ